jgi:hypothetical protein
MTIRYDGNTIIRHSVGDEFLHPLLVERIDEAIAASEYDLAEKVLQVIEKEERSRFGEGVTGISSAVRDFFAHSGIELTTTQQQEGE